MKQAIIGVIALILCLTISSCKEEAKQQKDFIAEVTALNEEAHSNMNEWTEDNWADWTLKAARLQLEFYLSDPTKEQYDAYSNITLDTRDANFGVAKTASKGMERVTLGYQPLLDSLENARRELMRKFRREAEFQQPEQPQEPQQQPEPQQEQEPQQP